MVNSIRTPKQGVTANSRRIAEAVDDEKWQEFRVSLKGLSTEDKIRRLRSYDWNGEHEGEEADCDTCIRIDNYIKALCRGGQLAAGTTHQDLHQVRIWDRIKKG